MSDHSTASSQLSQEIGESWQYALLLPFWVRPISSPAVIIGTPAARSMVAMRLRT